jgi:hypothetical protein
VCLLCNRVLLKTLQKFIKLNETVLIRILDLCKYFMMSLSENVHENYVKLMSYVPINILNSHYLDVSSLTSNDFSVFSRNARINYISTYTSQTTFNIHHFKVVMGYVLAGVSQR